MMLHAKLLTVQSLYILVLLKQMDILKYLMELNIQYYFILMKNVREFLIELDILLC